MLARPAHRARSATWLKPGYPEGPVIASQARRVFLRALGCAALTSNVRAVPLGAELPNEALRRRIEALLVAGDARIGAGSAAARAILVAVYRQRDFAPIWTDARRAGGLLSAIEASVTHGLAPLDYHHDALAHLIGAGALSEETHESAAERDLLLSDACMRLAYHLHFGKADPRVLQQGWNFARTLGGVDPVAALSQLLAASDPAAALDALAPQMPLYRNLRRALANLRTIEQRGGWPRVADGPALEVGADGMRVAQLQARLQASGDLAPAAGEATFDAEFGAAVRRFQLRHGLEADGVVGRVTLAALNVSVAERIAQVRANLERLRWVARELAGDYLLVDSAGFAAELWLADTLVWSARVVVGKPYRTTPEFRARMKYAVLNPAWMVPPTILREDILPVLVRDPGYLEKHAMRLLDRAGHPIDASTIDWTAYRDRPRAFPYQVVQAPGHENPLGTIKFLFPNEHSVYLHDTPTRGLFDKATRAASSGCIRIERPLELAQLLLDDPQHWSIAQLQQAIATGKTQTIALRRTVPVLLLYFTAVAGSDGEAHFRPDLYDRDRPILRALAAPFRFGPVDAVARTR